MLKRRHEGRTDYGKRLRLLLSNKPRLTIRKSLNKITAQIIEYSELGDKTIISASSNELQTYGWKASLKNTPAAYLTGLLIGKKSIEKKIKEATPDIGHHSPIKGAIVFAVLKGASDYGLKVNLKETIVPTEERIKGKHIADYATKNPNSFKSYKIDPKELPNHFEEIKQKILGKK